MRREAKRNKIIIIFLLGILFLMGAGYAAFQTKLTITGTGNISGEWNISITNVEVAEQYMGGVDVKHDFNDLTAELEANLYKKGDYVLYNITVENLGTFDAKLETLNLRQSTNDAVLITSSGFIKGEVLEKGQQKTVTVKIEYNPNYEGDDPSGTSGVAEVTLDFVQNSGGTIQPAQDYLLTYDYTTNGGTSTNAENAYLQEGSNINLNYTAEKEGYKFKGWNTNPGATEGLQALTMPGNELTLYAIFEYVDVTPPIINNVSATSTTNSITVVTSATEEEGEIAKYEYSINDGKNWVKVEGTNKYTFTDLSFDTEYTVLIKVTNKDGYSAEGVVSVKTGTISEPIFSENNNDESVTIIFPSGCQNGIYCEYSVNDDVFTEINQNTYDIDVSSPGLYNIKVKITAGNEEKIYTYTKVKYKKLSVTLLKGNHVSEIGKDVITCEVELGANECQVVLPSIIPMDGYSIIGWSDQLNASTGLEPKSILTITENVTYYANASDMVGPNVEFNPQSNSEYVSKGLPVEILVSDEGDGLKANQEIYYGWSKSNTAEPDYSNISLNNNNGDKNVTVTIPSDSSSNLTGTYYLWIKNSIEDTNGNISDIKISGPFNFDNVVPAFNNVSTNKTTNSIIVTVSANALSGIEKYEYSIDGGINWNESSNNYYEFNNLKQQTLYNILVKVTSNVGLSNTYETNVTTSELSVPTFSEQIVSGGKNIIISYMSGCGTTYTCSYRVNSGNWVDVSSSTVSVKVSTNGSLTAKISDNVNPSVSSTYNFSIFPVSAVSYVNALASESNSSVRSKYGARYYGSNPKNFINFNNELWRIIGVINGKLKIIKYENIGKYRWTDSTSNNNWNDEEVNTLKQYLNGDFYNSMEQTYKSMIAYSTYSLGGIKFDYEDTATASSFYGGGNGVNYWDDTTTNQYIGLMCPSDYGFATQSTSCYDYPLYKYNNYPTCYQDNWLFPSFLDSSDVYEWTQMPGGDTKNTAFVIENNGRVDTDFPVSSFNYVRPVAYLNVNVKITGGTGSADNPYNLSL